MTDLHIPASPTLRGDSISGNLDDSVYNRLLRERIIFLGSEVTDQVANRICAQLLLLSAEDPERDINLWINSPGGSVYSGMAIYDTMQFIDNDVSTVAMGMAASMGQLLLCAGTTGMFQERVAFHTGQDQAQIEADSDRDRWFTAEEAKTYGFIDKVITGATQVPEGA